MELTLQNVTSGHVGGDASELTVHFLRSCDGYTYGLCFKKHGNKTCETLWYGPKDVRGPISALVPPEGVYTTSVDRQWNTKAVIWKEKSLDHSLWSESAYMYTITTGQYIDYQKWIIEWAAAAGQYSIIEGGNTSREFMNASVEHFTDVGKPVFVLKQSVTTLELNYDSKEPVSVVDMNDALRWFKALRDSHSFSDRQRAGDVDAVIRFVTNGSLMYYREKVGGVTKIWKLTGARIRPYTIPLHYVESYPLHVPEVQLVQLPQSLPTPPAVPQVRLIHTPQAQAQAQAEQQPPTADPPRTSTEIAVVIVLVVVIIVIVIIVVMYMWHSGSTAPTSTVAVVPPQNTVVLAPSG